MPTRRTALAFLAAAAAAPQAGCAAPTPAAASLSPLVTAARRQIGVTNAYDAGYHRIAYPGGDVPRTTGACSDVVIRAARDAWAVDLQRLVHEDMARAFAAYPRRWGMAAPDPNIDHRRVPNLATFFTRAGVQVWRAGASPLDDGFMKVIAPGDILTWRSFVGGGTHIAIVSQIAGGAWLIQNYGWGVHEEALNPVWMTGVGAAFRWRPKPPAARAA